MADWRENLVEDDARLATLVRGVRRVAVLGIKTERQRGEPAYYVPEYLATCGVEVIPVPVYYPDVTHILGHRVERSVKAAAEVAGPLDLVDVFRRAIDLPAHLDDLLSARPAAVWLQRGIRHDGIAEALAREGVLVVQDRCLMVDHRRYRAAPDA